MKIGVSARGGSIEAEIEPRFGRSPYFLIVDPESMRFEAFTNPATHLPGGAGPRAVQELVRRGAGKVLTGQVGPKAQQALEAAGIDVVTGVTGTVRMAIEGYLAGEDR